nr:hypothetical protein [Tanacetum cinerariifolium]
MYDDLCESGIVHLITLLVILVFDLIAVRNCSFRSLTFECWEQEPHPSPLVAQLSQDRLPKDHTRLDSIETSRLVPEEPSRSVPKEPSRLVLEEPTKSVPKEPSRLVPKEPSRSVLEEPTRSVPKEPSRSVPKEPI